MWTLLNWYLDSSALHVAGMVATFLCLGSALAFVLVNTWLEYRHGRYMRRVRAARRNPFRF